MLNSYLPLTLFVTTCPSVLHGCHSNVVIKATKEKSELIFGTIVFLGQCLLLNYFAAIETMLT